MWQARQISNEFSTHQQDHCRLNLESRSVVGIAGGTTVQIEIFCKQLGRTCVRHALHKGFNVLVIMQLARSFKAENFSPLSHQGAAAISKLYSRTIIQAQSFLLLSAQLNPWLPAHTLPLVTNLYVNLISANQTSFLPLQTPFPKHVAVIQCHFQPFLAIQI